MSSTIHQEEELPLCCCFLCEHGELKASIKYEEFELNFSKLKTKLS